jgi:hypothetical protein
MLILMEEILLVGQCLNVLAHLLGRVGGGGSRQLTLIRQCRHLCRDRFGGVVLIRVVAGESTKCIMLEWEGGGIALMACGGGCRIESTLESFLN